VYDVVLLSLAEGGGPGAGACGAACGGCDSGGTTREACETPRVPVLKCAEALTAAGGRVETVTASSDAEIDAEARENILHRNAGAMLARSARSRRARKPPRNPKRSQRAVRPQPQSVSAGRSMDWARSALRA